MKLLRLLDFEWQRWRKVHETNSPRGMPVGGGDWIDSFFKMTALEGAIRILRNGGTPEAAIEEGKKDSAVAVDKWNQRHGYQVHRWRETCWGWIEFMVVQHKEISRI